jgi:hypothetical protein
MGLLVLRKPHRLLIRRARPGATPLDPTLERVRRRTARATATAVACMVPLAAALWTLQPRLALLPVAFILGWLNLVGL